MAGGTAWQNAIAQRLGQASNMPMPGASRLQQTQQTQQAQAPLVGFTNPELQFLQNPIFGGKAALPQSGLSDVLYPAGWQERMQPTESVKVTDLQSMLNQALAGMQGQNQYGY